MIADIARSATAGFGASFGRDIYRSGKKNPLLFVIVGAGLLIFGWRNLFMGIGRSAAYFFFVTLIGSLVMITVGAGMVMAAAAILQGKDSSNPGIVWGLLAIAVLSLIGILWGMSSRKARARRIEVEQRNMQFLADHGFTDAGFETSSLQDVDGHILKLIEQADDRMVFSVAGRRGLRAAIRLQEGEMVSYTGVVKAA